MDIITQGLLGSAVAVSVARQSEIKQAAWIGCIAGLLADADVLIRSSADPLLFLEYHRQFSHSLVFIPIGALIAACLIWILVRIRLVSELNFSRIYYYSFSGYMLSGLLDACTSYGTHLLWPFSDERIAWKLISIIDPIFTGVLLLSLIIALKMKIINVIRVGLVLCVLYLVVSNFQSKIAYELLAKLAADRGHRIERLIIKPTFGNVILWRSVYLSDGIYHIDAIQTLFDRKIYEGAYVTAFDIERDFPGIEKNSVQYQDIVRFNYFSDRYLSRFPGQANVIGDVRYSVFPLSSRSLWGIKINLEKPGSHVDFVTFRESNAEERSLFFNMLLGK